MAKRPIWDENVGFNIIIDSQEPPLKPTEIRWLSRMTNKYKPKEKKNEVSSSPK